MTTLDSITTQLREAHHPALPPGHPIANGKPQRYGPGKKFWYVLHEVRREDGTTAYAGAYGYWRGNDNGAETFVWQGHSMTAAERAALNAREREAAVREGERRDEAARKAASRAREQWGRASKEGTSSYLERKQITPESVRFEEDGTVLVPLIRYDNGDMAGLQKITPNGAKRFNTGMRKTGVACRLGEVSETHRFALLVEGYATGRSVRMATEGVFPVFVCVDAGNLLPAARLIRDRYPTLHLLFCADDDWMLERRLRAELTERYGVDADIAIGGDPMTAVTKSGIQASFSATAGRDENGIAFLTLYVQTGGQTRTIQFENAGLKHAHQAAAELDNASVVFSTFANRGERGLTDFNDLHVTEGLPVVRDQITRAVITALEPSREVEQLLVQAATGRATKAMPATPKTPGASPSAAAKNQREDAESGAFTWQMDLRRTDKGAIISSLNNVFEILRNDPEWAGVFAYEEFSGKVMKRRPPPFTGGVVGEWSDLDDVNAARWLEGRYGFSPRKEFVIDAAMVLADQNKYHVVRDYLAGLTWDRQGRLSDGWMVRNLNVEDSEYARLIGFKWPIAAVARVMEPGCKFDNVLILEGHQGFGKSTAIRILAGDDWFTDANIEIGNKDTYVTMRGKWIIELGELDSFSKAESSATKRFFSSMVDTYRPPYGRRAIDVPRQGIFTGTVNFDTYLKDESGNRRYWPIKVVREIHLPGIAAIRDQLWAEAYFYYCAWRDANERAGGTLPRPWDVAGPERHLFTAEQDARYEGDVYESLIRPFLQERERVTMRQLLEDCLKLDVAKWGRNEERRVGKVMKSLSWVRKRASVGARDYYYVRDERPGPASFTVGSLSEDDDAPL
ncbi:MAG: VapE domain-containing protein [Janthinobacterium lividum]